MATTRRIALFLGLASCGRAPDEPDWVALTTMSSSSSSSSGAPVTSGEVGTSTSEGGDTSTTEAIGETTEVSTSTGEAASSSSSETGAGSSTGPTAVCGDKIVDPGEDCDDGNGVESDRCSHDCRKIRLVFATSQEYSGDLDGLAGADGICRGLAAKEKLDNPKSRLQPPFEFKALLATSTKSALERHYHGTGPYQLVNGYRVSDSFLEMFTEKLEHPINFSERMTSQNSQVWTGMLPSGESFPGINFCHDWEGPTSTGTAIWGDADSVNEWWLYVDIEGFNPTTDCLEKRAIYCIEQE